MPKTPFPPFDKRIIEPRSGDGANRGKPTRTGNTAWHTMAGNLWSADSWFRVRGSGSLTPWGIGGALDGAHDGKILQFMDYRDSAFVPWSSGPWIAPGCGDGSAYVATFGVGGVNGLMEAIEFSGQVETPVSAKQWAAGIHLTAAIIHDAGKDSEHLAWTAEKANKSHAWNMQHFEIACKDGRECPFPRIRKYTKEYQKGILYTLQFFEGKAVPDEIVIAGIKVQLPFTVKFDPNPPPPPTDKPLYIEFKASGVELTIGPDGANGRQWGNRQSPINRVFKPGETIRFMGMYYGESVGGNDHWFVTDGPVRLRVHESGILETLDDVDHL